MSTPSDVLHFARKIGSSGNKKLASDSKAQQRCHNWASQKGGVQTTLTREQLSSVPQETSRSGLWLQGGSRGRAPKLADAAFGVPEPGARKSEHVDPN